MMDANRDILLHILLNRHLFSILSSFLAAHFFIDSCCTSNSDSSQVFIPISPFFHLINNQAKTNKTKTNIVDIQIGDKTQNHDQFITPQSFSTIKTICNASEKTNPLLLLFSWLILSTSLSSAFAITFHFNIAGSMWASPYNTVLVWYCFFDGAVLAVDNTFTENSFIKNVPLS